MVRCYVVKGEVKKETFALLDDGSDRHVVDTGFRTELGIETVVKDLGMVTLEHFNEGQRHVGDVDIEGVNGFKLSLGQAIFGSILASEEDVPPCMGDIQGVDHLQGIEFDRFPSLPSESGLKIGVIIGSEHAWTWILGERRSGDTSLPIGVSTEFGWALVGPRVSGRSSTFSCHHMSTHASEARDEIKRDYDRMFRKVFEPVDDEEQMSVEDKFAMKQLRDTIRFDLSVHRYRVGLPWKNGRAAAAGVLNRLNSSKMSLDRLRRSAGRLRADPVRQKAVFEQMQKFVDEGRVRTVTPEEVKNCPACKPQWTVPVHIVGKKDGRVRVCHDCKAAVSSICLNDFLLDGPALACKIHGVIMRFRDGGEVALGSDIAGFFHEVYVDEGDSGVFRYWWFTDERMSEVELKEFLGHVFGARSSSCVATFALRYHAEVNQDIFDPEVIEAIRKLFYVDDLCASKRDVPSARRFRVALTDALKQAGFDLVKWRSSHPEALVDDDGTEAARDPNSDVKTFDEDSDEKQPMEKVLGMCYSFARDEFSFRPDMEKMRQPVRTKREMLKLIASLYDPMGFLAPFLILARMIFQKAVQVGGGWDDLLPDDICAEFAAWQLMVLGIVDLRIRRWTSIPATQDAVPELHIFGDASTVAYGACAYRRAVGSGGEKHCAILFAKAHVVPVKVAAAGHHDTMPRLEMQASRLVVEIRRLIEAEVGKYARVVLWTDSTCVVKQLRDEKTRFKTYFANRISHIRAGSDVYVEWKCIPSDLNPADDLSRGLEPSDPKWQRFYCAPEFLWLDEEEWPCREVLAQALPAHVFAMVAEDIVAPKVSGALSWVLRVADGISLWRRKKRRVAFVSKLVPSLLAWCRRGGRTLRSDSGRVAGFSLSSSDLDAGERMLILAIQRRAFGEVMDGLVSLGVHSHDTRVEGKRVGTKLARLNPFVDGEGLLRCGGRLARAKGLSFEERFPLILPRADPNVDALILLAHAEAFHAGVDHVLGDLRRRFWILSGRQTVRRVVLGCVKCQMLFKEPMSQKMAPLPEVRVSRPGSPFECTGVDVFGPFEVKIAGRAMHKVWVALFTCMAVRAVHFEVLRDMSASTFINALIRFRARRPGVRRLFSDNGTNFSSADKEIRACVEAWNRESADELAMQGLSWTFIPPLSPHYGGVWERCVKSAKRHLTAMLAKEGVHIEVFTTVLVKAESIMNHRPLTRVGADVRDCEPLTPMHFLAPGVFLHSSDELLPPCPPDANTLRYSWKRSWSLIEGFWKRWSRDYVSALQARPKWRRTEPDLKVGDVVLLVDQQLRRGDWRLGMVDQVFGDESHVRKVLVRTADRKEFLRDRTKVVRLELDPVRGSA